MSAMESLVLLKASSASVPLFTPIPSVAPSSPVYERVSETGAKTLWVVFVIMLLSTITFGFLSVRVPVQKRLFHVLTLFITLFASLSYFAMATGDGNSFIAHSENTFRQVFWARYIDWVFTTPLLLLDLAFLAGLDGASILIALVADILMILFGLFAALARTNSLKWAYYAFSCIAYLSIVFLFLFPGRRAASTQKAGTSKLFAGLGGFTLLLWTLYPIVWGIGDGARLWSVDAEIVSYAILDVLAKPVFGFWLLLAHSRNAESIEGFWSHGLSTEGALRVGDEE